MHIETSGFARVRDRQTGEIYEIEADELEWHENGEYERQMGPETEYAAVVYHEVLGELTWKLWEYPAGAGSLSKGLMRSEIPYPPQYARKTYLGLQGEIISSFGK